MANQIPFIEVSSNDTDNPSADPSRGAQRHHGGLLSASSPNEDSFALDEDLPPAYTPSADIRHGESTIEVGPARPFQPPPRAPPRRNHELLSPQDPRPLQQGSYHQRSSSAGTRPLSSPAAPNEWSPYTSQPSPSLFGSRSRSGGLISRALGELVREVTDAMAGPSGPTLQPQHSVYAPPTGAPPAPPSRLAPGPMPDQAYGRSLHHSRSASNITQPGLSNDIVDDGSPTKTPVPGHPLLRDGMFIVYPNGFDCPKCRNTGYKNFDPSHPCNSCWEKYGRLYRGALAYAPWSNAGSSSSHSSTRTTFQRPLPKLNPPQFSTSNGTTRTSSSSQRSLRPAEQYYVDNTMVAFRPPPGAVVVSPGDPRLGGRLCWRCGGGGTLPLLFIDTRPCNVCGGTGRTHR